MLRLTDEELSRVQDLCRVLPPWKARQIFASAGTPGFLGRFYSVFGAPRLPKKDRRRRVVDKEDPGAVWQLPTHLHAVMVHLDIDRPPSSA